MALLGGGCVVDGGPLPEAAIDGATSSQREVLEGELDRFDLHAGRGRVRLASVALDDDVEAVEGTPGVYDHRRKALRVDESLEGEELATAVRHLLCHALDLQLVRSWETLASELAPHVEAVSGVYPEGYVDDLRRAPPMTTSERDLAETFAGFCDEGAEVARLLAVSCPGDPETEPETASAWAAVSSSAWRGGGGFTRSAQPASDSVQWPVDEVVSSDRVEIIESSGGHTPEQARAGSRPPHRHLRAGHWTRMGVDQARPVHR